MTVTNPRLASVTLAAYGWMPKDWAQRFYPEDLPSIWQMVYYSNDFNEVLVPAMAWESGALDADWAALPAGFELYLEITTALLESAHWAQVRECIEQTLAAQISGLWVDATAQQQLPLAWKQDFAVHLATADALLAVMPTNANAQLGLLRVNQNLTALELRTLFEQLQAKTAHKDVVLFLDTPYAVVGQIQLMRQLYGV